MPITNDQLDVRPPYQGVPFYFKNGKYLIIPALPLGALEEEDAKWEALGDDPEPPKDADIPTLRKFNRETLAPATRERMKVMRQTVFRAIKRNYPAFDEADMDELFTFDNRTDLFNAARGLADKDLQRVTSVGGNQARGSASIDYDWIYGRLAMGFPGWTFEYIRERVTMPEVFRAFRAWHENPPAHELIALIATALGWERNASEAPVDPATPTSIKAPPRQRHRSASNKSRVVAQSKDTLHAAVAQIGIMAGHVGTISK